MNPVIALIVANLIWGAASPIFKFALMDIPPFILLFVRFALASLIFLPFIKGYRFEKLKPKYILLIIVGGILGFTVHIGLLFIGLEKTDSINAPIILSTAPVFLILVAWIFLKEKIRTKSLIGTIVSLVGVLIIILLPILSKHDGAKVFTQEIEGNLLYVVSTIALVASTLILKPLSEKIPPLVLTYLAFVTAAATFLPFAILELQHWSFSSIHLPGIMGIIYGTFLSSALAYILYFYGMSKISTQEIGIFTYSDPIAAILVAAPLLGEMPDKFFILGSLLVFGGIYISEGRIHYHPIHKIKNRYN